MCDRSGGEVGHRRHQTTEQSVGDGGSGTTNDWRATIGRRWRIMDEQESARDGRKMIGDDGRPEEPQSLWPRGIGEDSSFGWARRKHGPPTTAATLISQTPPSLPACGSPS
ncbi:hypothetical protein E3N88_10676 [Mikania micrantha]|uniref:Uncharacterized protein n=1 Tax=Mikania micrantha TaxID=192012 RepID=A0A5N6PBF3_9ASTR|nr:hypothetical protein E3N88_10676 [Mikania micrantha]